MPEVSVHCLDRVCFSSEESEVSSSSFDRPTRRSYSQYSVKDMHFSTLFYTHHAEQPGCKEQVFHLLGAAYSDLPGRLKKSKVCRETY